MSPPVNQFVPHNSTQEFIEKFDNYLVDCDGVIWSGPIYFDDAKDALCKLKKMGKRVLYVTNNSTRTRQQYVEKLTAAGFPAELDDIVCTAHLTALYLKEVAKCEGKVYVLGTMGVGKELSIAGIQHIGIGPDAPSVQGVMETGFAHFIETTEVESGVTAVVAAFDPFISYPKMIKAVTYLQNKDCLFLTTNQDVIFPQTGSALTFPGTGSVVSGVLKASGREPIVMGKPSTRGFDMISKKFHLDKERTLMVGDNLYSDVLFAHNCGISSLAVMTGTTTQAEIKACMESSDPEQQKKVPTYWMERLGDLNHQL